MVLLHYIHGMTIEYTENSPKLYQYRTYLSPIRLLCILNYYATRAFLIQERKLHSHSYSVWIVFRHDEPPSSIGFPHMVTRHQSTSPRSVRCPHQFPLCVATKTARGEKPRAFYGGAAVGGKKPKQSRGTGTHTSAGPQGTSVCMYIHRVYTLIKQRTTPHCACKRTDI